MSGVSGPLNHPSFQSVPAYDPNASLGDILRFSDSTQFRDLRIKDHQLEGRKGDDKRSFS